MKKICLPNEQNPSFVIIPDEDGEGAVVEQHYNGEVYGMFDLELEELKMLAVGLFSVALSGM